MGDDVPYPNKRNRFAFCFKFVKSLPVIFVCSLIGYSYYCYIVQLTFNILDSIAQRIIYALIYHILLIMLAWSYYQTVFTWPGQVPKKFRLPEGVIEQLRLINDESERTQVLEKYGNELPIYTRTYINNRPTFRYCFTCYHLKPDRCHHCRICGTCVLKMDHHCPWVNNCVSFTNYKAFILFLFYGFLFCLFLMGTSFPSFLQIWKESNGSGGIHIIFLFIISLMFLISVMSIFSYHIYLISCNRTTLEGFRGPIFSNGRIDKNGYDIGVLKNIRQVFGDNLSLWPFPIFTSLGNGISFLMRRKTYERKNLLDENYNSDSYEGEDDQLHDVFTV